MFAAIKPTAFERCFLHWVKSLVKSRLRRIALNMLQRETSGKRSIRIKRLKAGWDHDYLLQILQT